MPTGGVCSQMAIFTWPEMVQIACRISIKLPCVVHLHAPRREGRAMVQIMAYFVRRMSVDVNECICSAVPHNGTCSAVIFLGMLLASFLFFFFLFLSLSTSPSTGFTYFYKFAILMWAVVELCWFHQCWCSVVVMCVQYAMLRTGRKVNSSGLLLFSLVYSLWLLPL